jgi:gliding motility-associated-like protein
LEIVEGSLTFFPADFGLRFYPGETIEVALKLCDSPDLCDPNCAEYSWYFCLMPTEGCDRIPNPFTPNGDGINDYVQFTYDGIYYEPATLSIYNTYDILVRRIGIPAGSGAKDQARWNGKNSDGKTLNEGLYIYTIERSGEIVCEGTVTIAR